MLEVTVVIVVVVPKVGNYLCSLLHFAVEPNMW